MEPRCYIDFTLRSKHCQLNYDRNLSYHIHCEYPNFRDIKSQKKKGEGILEIIKCGNIIKTIIAWGLRKCNF